MPCMASAFNYFSVVCSENIYADVFPYTNL